MKRRFIAFYILFFASLVTMSSFQNCAKTNFTESASKAASVDSLSCDPNYKPATQRNNLACPSGVGTVSQYRNPFCNANSKWAFAEWLPTPTNFSTCSCAIQGQQVNSLTGLCACPSGQSVIAVGGTNVCGVPSCGGLPAKPAESEAKACPYNSGLIVRSRLVSLNACTWQAGSWSSWNAAACSCPSGDAAFNPSTGDFSCQCPAGTAPQGNSCVQLNACSPLSPNYDPNCNRKLKAKLYFQVGSPDAYLGTGWTSPDTYITQGSYSGEIYFTDLFIPTRSFTAGFPGVDNRTEFFGLDITTALQPSSQMPQGSYQLGVISDDGAILSYTNSSNQEIQLLSQDNITSSRLNCATQPLTIYDNQKTRLRLKYFQGPRDALALVLLYRTWSQSVYNSPLACGYADQNMFGVFPVAVRTNSNRDYPGTPYAQLLLQGWKVVPAESFTIY